MQRSIFQSLAVLAVLALLFSGGGAVLAQHWLANNVTPAMVSYQGSVTVGGALYTGTGYFKFAIVNSAGNTSYWSNDNTSFGGGQPGGYVALPVSGGLFSVLLGKPPLWALDASVFSTPDRLLRVWFSASSGGPFTQLTPDREFASAPFAMQAENADKLNGLPASFYQMRVSAECVPGSTIQGIDAYGNVTCLPVQARPAFSRLVADLGGGYHASLEIGADGLPVMAYLKYNNLYVVHCHDLACLSSTSYNVDDGWNVAMVGFYNDITIGLDGFPLISYLDITNNDLKVAHCQDAACASASKIVVDGTDIIYETAITIGADGLPIISYMNSSGDLRVAHCADADCSSSAIANHSSANQIGYNSAIAIGTDGKAMISFQDYTAGALQVFHCSDLACTSGRLTTVDSGACGLFTSITVGADGMPLISYYDEDDGALKVAHCNDLECFFSPVDIRILDWQAAPGMGKFTSIAIGADGLPVISYHDANSWDLKVAHCSDPQCLTTPVLTVVDWNGNLGAYSSIKIGADGMPVIAYLDAYNTDLKFVHCANTFCTPYVRR